MHFQPVNIFQMVNNSRGHSPWLHRSLLFDPRILSTKHTVDPKAQGRFPGPLVDLREGVQYLISPQECLVADEQQDHTHSTQKIGSTIQTPIVIEDESTLVDHESCACTASMTIKPQDEDTPRPTPSLEADSLTAPSHPTGVAPIIIDLSQDEDTPSPTTPPEADPVTEPAISVIQAQRKASTDLDKYGRKIAAWEREGEAKIAQAAAEKRQAELRKTFAEMEERHQEKLEAQRELARQHDLMKQTKKETAAKKKKQARQLAARAKREEARAKRKPLAESIEQEAAAAIAAARPRSGACVDSTTSPQNHTRTTTARTHTGPTNARTYTGAGATRTRAGTDATQNRTGTGAKRLASYFEEDASLQAAKRVCNNVSDTTHHNAALRLEEEMDRRLDDLFLDPDERENVNTIAPAYEPRLRHQIAFKDESSEKISGPKAGLVVPRKTLGVDGLNLESDDDDDDEQEEDDEEEDRALLARIEAELAGGEEENEQEEEDEEEDSAFLARIEAELADGEEGNEQEEEDEEENSAFLARIEAEPVDEEEEHGGNRIAAPPRAVSVESVESEEE